MSFNFQNLDLSNVEFSSGSSVIPVGDHVATVTGAEMTKSATGASQIKVTVENADKQSLGSGLQFTIQTLLTTLALVVLN